MLGRGRVPGVATFVRWLCLCAAAVFTGLLLAPPRADVANSPEATIVAGVLVGLLDLAALRALFLGVWVRGGLVTVRDWFRTTVIPADAIRAVSVTMYEGFLVRGSSSGFQILSLSIDGRRPVHLHASVALWPSTRRKRDRLRAALGLPAVAEAGEGRRRHRAA